MAQRRMFAKTIIQSDAFLNLTPKSQCLYIQLNMYADDDGVVNNAKSIMATINCTKKEYNELLESKFIIELDKLTIIKHWRINNYIQSDRRKPSNYRETLDKLNIDQNNAYTMHSQIEQQSIQNVYKMDTQVSIGKDSIDNNRINNYNIDMDTILLYKYINNNKRIESEEATQLIDLIKVYGKGIMNETIIQINEKYNEVTIELLKQYL